MSVMEPLVGDISLDPLQEILCMAQELRIDIYIYLCIHIDVKSLAVM